jgi:hypothetical protein
MLRRSQIRKAPALPHTGALNGDIATWGLGKGVCRRPRANRAAESRIEDRVGLCVIYRTTKTRIGAPVSAPALTVATLTRSTRLR